MTGDDGERKAEALRRLGLISLFHRQAEGHAASPYPLSTSAVMGAHDVVELFLGLVADYLNRDIPKRIDFLEYWDLINKRDPPPPQQLGQYTAMRRLNDLRVAFKHHGTVPSEDAVTRSLRDVRVFLVTSSEALLGADFESISLAGLIPQEMVRQLVESGTRFWVAGDPVQATRRLAIAWNLLTGEFGEISPQGRKSPYRFGPALDKPHVGNPRAMTGKPTATDHRLHDTQKFVAGMADAVIEMRAALRIVALGIDFPSYARFKRQTPNVHWLVSGAPYLQGSANMVINADGEWDFCLNFIVSGALRLADVADNYEPTRRTSGFTISRYGSVQEMINAEPGTSTGEVPEEDGLDASIDGAIAPD